MRIKQLFSAICYIFRLGVSFKGNEGNFKMRNFVKTFAAWFSADSESGVTAIEYGLIAALISVVIIVAVTAIGTNLNVVFTTISGKLASAV
jgi:pilus assembly protein Flp/PilA